MFFVILTKKKEKEFVYYDTEEEERKRMDRLELLKQKYLSNTIKLMEDKFINVDKKGDLSIERTGEEEGEAKSLQDEVVATIRGGAEEGGVGESEGVEIVHEDVEPCSTTQGTRKYMDEEEREEFIRKRKREIAMQWTQNLPRELIIYNREQLLRKKEVRPERQRNNKGKEKISEEDEGDRSSSSNVPRQETASQQSRSFDKLSWFFGTDISMIPLPPT